MSKPVVLVLCTGNSCRSQMAEGFLRHLAGDLFEVQSAGSRPTGQVHPQAVAAMAEVGIDISGHESKSMDRFLKRAIQTVFVVCDSADRECPTFPGQTQRYFWGFRDPAGVAPELKAEEFRRVRDQIGQVFGAWVAGYREGKASQSMET